MLPPGSSTPERLLGTRSECVHQDLVTENQELRARLEEAEEALRAIREGEVDAIIVSGSKGNRVFSLTEAENLHRLMVETMNEAGFAVSAEGLLLYVNDRAAELLKRRRSDLMGHPIEAFVAPVDVARLRRLLDATNAGTADDRMVFRTARGAEVPMHLWASRLPRPDGAMICLVGTDLTRIEADQVILTQLREHQQALNASRAEALERLSQALVAREQAAKLAQDLRESDRRKDVFLATLAHELRNPLAPIRHALEILRLQDTGTATDAKARELMERHLAHLVRLVDDLLDVSRITHGKIELLKERLALETVIETAMETVRPHLQTSGHRLSVDLPPGAVWLDADPTRLSQVFGNLLHNAIKYTPPGQTIRLVGRLLPAGEVSVSVEDSGSGIPAEILPHVFDMFAQGPASPMRNRAGLGIGLTLVRTLVELHGGRVEAFSAGPDQGSRIDVYLPLAAGECRGAGKPSRDSCAVRITCSGRRILVVDDNRDAAVSLASALELKGAEVRVAYDGHAVLSALEEAPADVVILDIGMPDLDGHEVARRIRARPDRHHIQLIAITGLGDLGIRQRSLEVGFDHHLVKPVSFEILDEILAAPPGASAGLHSAPGAYRACARAPAVDPKSRSFPMQHGDMVAGTASRLLHDLAQPLSAAGCFAFAARMLAAEAGGPDGPLRDAIDGIAAQVQLANLTLVQLRGLLAHCAPPGRVP